MTNSTTPIEAAFGMQRQSLKHGERLFEDSLDLQRNGAEAFLENSIAIQRNAQRQSVELARQLFDTQFEAFSSAYDDAVRSAVTSQLEEFNASQSDNWDEFEDDFSEAVDDLSDQQREVATQMIEDFIGVQKDMEEQTIENVQQAQEAADETTEDVTEAAEEQVDATADATDEAADETEEATEETAEDGAEAAEEQADATDDETEEPLEDIEGLGTTYADRLREHGVESNTHLAQANVETIAQAADVTEHQAEQWSERAQAQA